MLVSADPNAPSPYWLDDIRNCGPRCLQFLEHWYGGQRPFREISKLCPPLRDGVPLEQVAGAARQLGWGVTPFTASAGQLSRLVHPAILHLERAEHSDASDKWKNNHFVVLLGHDPSRNEFLLFDPPGNVHAVSARYLAQRASGLGLLIDQHATPSLSTALGRRPLWLPVCFAFGLISASLVLACRTRVSSDPEAELKAAPGEKTSAPSHPAGTK